MACIGAMVMIVYQVFNCRIFQPNICCGYSKEQPQLDGSFKHQIIQIQTDVFLNSNRCLPVELASHLCCHFSNPDSLIAVFISSMVTASVTSGISSVPSAPFLASLSMISFPSISACPGVQLISIFIPLSSMFFYCLLYLSNNSCVWFVLPS